MTETETTKTCMVCGRPISEGEEAVPLMAESGPLVEPPEGPALWAHLRCFQPDGLEDVKPPSEK